MLNENLRRLSPEEIKANLPKILAAHNRKEARVSERREVTKFQKTAAAIEIGTSLADRLKSAYRQGARFRSQNGRFLSLKVA